MFLGIVSSLGKALSHSHIGRDLGTESRDRLTIVQANNCKDTSIHEGQLYFTYLLF